MGRKFTEEEVALVLKRAAELQSKGLGGDSRNLTLEEVVHAASEAGIDTALVRRAARELDRPPISAPPSGYSHVIGGPRQIRIERELDGEVPESAYEVVVEEIRAYMGEVGTVSTLGRSLSWSSGPAVQGNSPRMVHVSIVPRNGKTVIRVQEKLGPLMGALFGGLLGGLGGGGIMIPMVPMFVGMPWLLPITIPLWLGGVFGIARRTYGAQARKREEQAHALGGRIVALCDEFIARDRPALGPAD